jgi:DNA polymerase elongation subunit (family B)
MPVNLHILDIYARDEKVISANEEEQLVEYSSGSDVEDDDEFQPKKKGFVPKGKADHSGKTIIIHMFGKTAQGASVRVDVRGFKPFFYIRCPDGGTTIQEQAKSAVREYLKRHLNPTSIVKTIAIERCQRKELFGFTQDKAVNMLKLTMPSIALYREVKNCFCNNFWKPELKKIFGGKPDFLGAPFHKEAPTVYEANLDPMLRFLHLRNLKPCNWSSVEGYDEEDLELDDTNVLECDWEDVSPCDKPPAATAPFIIASWDIECMSTTGAFPMATRGDPIIQIGVILSKLGSTEVPEKHIFTLGTCDEIPEGKVHSYKDEKKLLLGFFQWLQVKEIDIFIGYNIFGFDEKYVWERCDQLGITGHQEVQALNRLADEGSEMKLEEKRLSSSAMGDNFLFLWNTTGRLRVDLYHYIKRGYQLPSYKLDDTSRNFLGESVKGIEEKADGWILTVGTTTKQDVAEGRSVVLLNAGGDSLCEKLNVIAYEPGRIVIEMPDDVIADEVATWAVVKDDLSPKEMFKMQGQGSAERAVIARYCVQDCQLVLDLFKKLDVFNNAMSMANVCSVPVSYIFLRGQGVKIESLMFKYCYESGQAIAVLPAAQGDSESYEGAIVLDPVPGFYTSPVGVADFASLYPSTIISENISHDTLVWVKDFSDDGSLIRVVWGSDEYDNLEGQRYTDIEYDNMIDDPEDQRKVKTKIKAGTRVCRYAQDRIGTIPKIVAGLLAARKAKRKEGANEPDLFKKALLESEQLAYKLTANSLYGQLGSGTFKVRLKPLAASVTAYGRKQILFAKAAIEDRYGRAAGSPHYCATADTVYGDSVKGDTPVFVRRGGVVEILRLDEVKGSWVSWHETKECIDLDGVEIWTDKGWTRCERIIRHRLAPTKKMFRILTHTGVVDCTEDHSLVGSQGQELKPSDVSVGTELMHNDAVWKEFDIESLANIETLSNFQSLNPFTGSVICDSKKQCSHLIIFLQRNGYKFRIYEDNTNNTFIIPYSKTQMTNYNYIQKMYEIDTTGIDYVYDLQTENHHFAVGPGNLVVHNTDSLFINFNPRDPETGKPLEGKAAVEKTIELTEEAGKYVTKALKAPHDFEFDKVYWPFIIFSKKRYVGHKYESADKHCLWFMGVALKRRDYAAIVKRIYSSALNILLNERDVPKAAKLVQDMAVELVEGKFGLQPLTISKSLRAEYADPSRIAHKALADRIAVRDPGNAPASGDRIPFVYIQAPVGQAAPELQGDRIETPTYIKEKGLKPDYMFYIDHQISNPICQLFGIVVDQIPGFESYKPRGGWKHDSAEQLTTQRETAAYHLLFGEAIQRNNMGAKSSFLKMMNGGKDVDVSSATTRSSRIPRVVSSSSVSSSLSQEPKKRQSTLDSLFADVMKLDAAKTAQKTKRATAAATAKKTETPKL